MRLSPSEQAQVLELASVYTYIKKCSLCKKFYGKDKRLKDNGKCPNCIKRYTEGWKKTHSHHLI